MIAEADSLVAWVEFPGGRRIKIRGAGGSNSLFLRRLDQLVAPFAADIASGLVDPAESDEWNVRAYAASVVMAWEGIRDTRGRNVECTAENVTAYFKSFPFVFAEVSARADEIASRQEREIDEAAEVLKGWLTWAMEWGEKEDQLLDMAEQGMDVPALKNRPEIIGHRWLWLAYLSLTSCRGMSTIPWSAIQDYATVNGYTDGETYMLHRVVPQLEHVVADRSKQKAKNKAASTKPPLRSVGRHGTGR